MTDYNTNSHYDTDSKLTGYNADAYGDYSEWICPTCGYTNYSYGTGVTCKNCTKMTLQQRDPAMEPSHQLGKLSRSKGEERITDVLNELGIEFEIEKSFQTCRDQKALRFDFCLPEYNILIEYDGLHHFEPVKWAKSTSSDKASENLDLIKHRDTIKDTWAKDNGYTLVRITHKQFKHIDKLINFWVDIAESDALNGSEALLDTTNP